MAADATKEIQFEIGHVLFIDIVGYSKLLIEEQKERLGQLTSIVLGTAQVRDSTDEQLVRLPTGDGMALVFHHSAEEPARCALEIAEALRKHPEIPVRMGIHSGPVSEVTDVSGRNNIAGAGINMAQRVMDCGDAGHILLSQHVADDLVHSRQWASLLRDLGECEVKHGIRLHLVNLYAEPLGNATLPQKFQQAKPKSAPRRNTGLKAALAVIAVLVAGAAYYFVAHRAPQNAAISENSQKGDATAALAEIEQEKSENWRMIGLPMAYCALGRKTDADAALDTLIAKYEKDSPYNIAYAYAFCGDVDKAFEWLDKAAAYQDPGLSEIVAESLFDKIHSGPRWLRFLRKIGMAPDQLAKIEFKVTLPRTPNE
jgi:hypothetical protein